MPRPSFFDELTPIGMRLITSTPQASADVDDAGADERRGEVGGLLARPALRVDRRGRRRQRQPGRQPGGAGDVEALLADLADAAADDLADLGRVDAGALDDRLLDDAEQLGRMDAREAATTATDRRANGIDDDDGRITGHGVSLRSAGCRPPSGPAGSVSSAPMVSVHDLQALEAGLEHGTAVDLAGTAAPPSGELVALLAQGAHTSPAAIMLTDARLDEPGPVIRYVNPACEALTGYAAADLIGTTPRILHGPATDRSVLDAMRVALAADSGFEGRVINYRADGTPVRHALACRGDAGCGGRHHRLPRRPGRRQRLVARRAAGPRAHQRPAGDDRATDRA